ncbi:MAG: hypothetical protein ACTSU5_13125 [Promethearchaeota archaeon]
MSSKKLHKRIRTKVRSSIQHGIDDLTDVDARVKTPPSEKNRYEQSVLEKKKEKILRTKEKAKKPHLRGSPPKTWELDLNE